MEQASKEWQDYFGVREMSYKTRRKSQKLRILALLEQRRSVGATNRDFIDMDIFRYGDRIKNLRDMGYDIESKRIKGGLWKYTLKGFQEDKVVYSPEVEKEKSEQKLLFNQKPNVRF